jgi:hypothetical protein
MTNDAVPGLVIVTVNGLLVVFTVCAANVSDVGDKEMPGAVPVPLNCTVCGLEGSESLIESTAVLVPVAVGMNRRVIVQLPPTANFDPLQLLSCENSDALGPLKL